MSTQSVLVVNPATFFNSAVYYGIMSQEDADRELMANIDKRIKKEFKEISGIDLRVTHCAANGMYRIRVPKTVRVKYELGRDQYYSKTEKGVLQALYHHTEGNRELYIPDAALPVLEKIMSKAKSNELFLGKTGKWLLTQELNGHLKDACKSLGIEYLSTHKVRSWFATEAAKNGMDDVTMMSTF